jgi:hypothetical protein
MPNSPGWVGGRGIVSLPGNWGQLGVYRWPHVYRSPGREWKAQPPSLGCTWHHHRGGLGTLWPYLGGSAPYTSVTSIAASMAPGVSVIGQFIAVVRCGFIGLPHIRTDEGRIAPPPVPSPGLYSATSSPSREMFSTRPLRTTSAVSGSASARSWRWRTLHGPSS